MCRRMMVTAESEAVIVILTGSTSVYFFGNEILLAVHRCSGFAWIDNTENCTQLKKKVARNLPAGTRILKRETQLEGDLTFC